MKKTESRLEEAFRSADIVGGRSSFSSPSSPSTSREGGESSGRPATEKGSGEHAVAEAATSEGVTGADSKPGEAEVGAVAASPSATVDDRQPEATATAAAGTAATARVCASCSNVRDAEVGAGRRILRERGGGEGGCSRDVHGPRLDPDGG